MTLSHWTIVLATTGAALVGCTDDASAPPTITFRTTGVVPEVLALKDGDGAWSAVPIGAAEEQAIPIAGTYLAYAYACSVEPGDVINWNLTIEHLATAELDGPITPCPGPRVHIAGLAAAAWSVHVDREYVWHDPATQRYQATISAGTHDLVAQGDPSGGRIVIRRGEVIDADRTIDLPLDAGTTLASAPFSFIGDAGAYRVTSLLVTAGGTEAKLAGLPGGPQRLALPAVADRAPGDKVLAIASTPIPGLGWRTVQHLITGVEIPPFEFAEPLAIEVAQPRYTWVDGPYATETTITGTRRGTPRSSTRRACAPRPRGRPRPADRPTAGWRRPTSPAGRSPRPTPKGSSRCGRSPSWLAIATAS